MPDLLGHEWFGTTTPPASGGHLGRRLGRALMASLGALVLGSASGSGAQEPEAPAFGIPEIRIPAEAEWVDRGRLFQAGVEGDWDFLLWGGFTVTAVRLQDEILLYYQGSSSYREEFDPTVCERSIGLAHGDPGEGFEKSGDAPVLTWSPMDGCEEGAAAGAAVVLQDEVLLYYGANTLTSRTQVSADIRLARSDDGRAFRDVGIVVAHDDPGVWGGGDELFPLLTFVDGPSTLLYYVPNGTRFARQLGVATGPAPDRLTESRRVRDPRGRPVTVWGPAGYGRVGPGLVALVLKGGPEADMEVRLVDPSRPDQVSDPVEVYSFGEVSQATVVLDEDLGSWLMFYRGDDFYGLKTAAVTPSGNGGSGG
ncbi:MAG: hypothetical protein P8188_06670 [Gemmatimonadota bacterium]